VIFVVWRHEMTLGHLEWGMVSRSAGKVDDYVVLVLLPERWRQNSVMLNHSVCQRDVLRSTFGFARGRRGVFAPRLRRTCA
jgi:hypothetical protein